MRFHHYINCLLALGRVTTALTAATTITSVQIKTFETTVASQSPVPVPTAICDRQALLHARISSPQNSLLTIFLNPLRELVDLVFRRALHTSKQNLKRLPWTIATYPSYAFQAEDGWKVPIHGNLYKRQNLSLRRLDSLVETVLINAHLRRPSKLMFWERYDDVLNRTEADHARTMMRDIASAPLKGGIIGVSFDGCNNHTVLPFSTNSEGSFYGMATVPYECIPATIANIQKSTFTLTPCNVETGFDINNFNVADVFFVPPRGITIVSDIDDILRVAAVWNFKQAVLNVFARPFRPWRNMPAVFWDLKKRIEAHGQHVHFHYMTDAPELIAGAYIKELKLWYPEGSFDFRQLNLTRTKELFHPRVWNTKRLMESFPDRRFIFLGDTTSGSLMKWPKIMKEYWPQIQCILNRDVQATEPSDWLKPDTHEYLDIPRNSYLFYRIPEDLRRLSGKHLAFLRPLDPSEQATRGCFDADNHLRQSLQPSNEKGTKLKSLARAAGWTIKCAFIFKRPNHKCPWDRLAGTRYYDGGYEAEKFLVPYTDHLNETLIDDRVGGTSLKRAQGAGMRSEFELQV